MSTSSLFFVLMIGSAVAVVQEDATEEWGSHSPAGNCHCEQTKACAHLTHPHPHITSSPSPATPASPCTSPHPHPRSALTAPCPHFRPCRPPTHLAPILAFALSISLSLSLSLTHTLTLTLALLLPLPLTPARRCPRPLPASFCDKGCPGGPFCSQVTLPFSLLLTFTL